MQRNKSDAAERSLLTAEVAARLVGVSPRMIRKLADSGHIQRAGRGKYPFVSVTQGYIRYLEERRAAAVARAGPENALAAAKAREVELRTARDEGRLVDMEDVEAVVARIRKTIASEFAGIFANLPLDIRVRAEAGVAGALSRLDRGTSRAIADLKAGRDPLADASPDID
ncbi:type IV toxin-antitoxin system AbiEi family antitoxin domain-containing protein [Camelimonas lactis]|uniref:AbiEi antitoxin N-terminal domain-containing protein n=1 Tax=Camelimonas lactis TaxID=659006 RepID=A0A4R2GJM4_9HYPH|nr:type IV toxin-antitoxin system AbiEi family antitoxin domain-containing protein [Camelimonas lactis]TCO07593.1 hypothetical protein EV666_1304 [Camelimonas lactis]